MCTGRADGGGDSGGGGGGGGWNGALLVSVLLHAELGLSEASFHSSESAGDHYYCVRIDATQYCCLKATDFFLCH